MWPTSTNGFNAVNLEKKKRRKVQKTGKYKSEGNAVQWGEHNSLPTFNRLMIKTCSYINNNWFLFGAPIQLVPFLVPHSTCTLINTYSTGLFFVIPFNWLFAPVSFCHSIWLVPFIPHATGLFRQVNRNMRFTRKKYPARTNSCPDCNVFPTSTVPLQPSLSDLHIFLQVKPNFLSLGPSLKCHHT